MRRWVILAGLAILAAAPALADPPVDPATADRKSQDMIDTAKAVYGESPGGVSCAKHDADEIVVCLDRPKDQRVPSTSQTDPNSRAARKALDGNIPSAPFVGSIRCRQGADGECRGNVGGAPTPAYYVDVSALPQAPEGSDADRIAKGEVPAP